MITTTGLRVASVLVILSIVACGAEREVDPARLLPAANEVDEVSGSPLEEFLGSPVDPVELSNGYARAYRGWAADVTDCMTQAGFQYVEPVPKIPPPEEFIAVRAAQRGSELKEHGYGIASNLRLQLRNAEEGGFLESPPTAMAGMSPTEQQAFLLQRARCLDDAAAANPLPDAIAGSEAFLKDIQAARENIDRSETMVVIWKDWAACMADVGYRAETRVQLVEQLNDRSASVQAQLNEFVRSLAAEGGGVDLVPNGIWRSIEVYEAYETRVLAQDITCSNEMNLERRLAKERNLLEARYLKENGERLRQLLVRRNS